MLVGCGNSDVDKKELANSMGESESVKLEEENLDQEEIQLINREEASEIINKYLENYKFNDYVDKFVVTNNEGYGGDFVAVRLITLNEELYNDELIIKYDADTMQNIYKEMVYYCNDLLNELSEIVPNYKDRLVVYFSGDFIEKFQAYPPSMVDIAIYEGKKEIINDNFAYDFRNEFGYQPELIEVEDLD